MDIVYTNENLTERGFLEFYSADFEVGGTNDFVVSTPKNSCLHEGCVVHVPETDFGGLVHKVKAATSNDSVEWGGSTWFGILDSRVICPPAGKDHLTVDGEANRVISYMIEWLGLEGLFTVSMVDSGIRIVSHRFDRYDSGYVGITDMLSKCGAILRVKFDEKAVLWCEKAKGAIEEDSETAGITVTKDYWPVNHMICMGEGEMKDRIRVDLYADTEGNVSQAQSIFGQKVSEFFYDYTSADMEKLIEDGTKKMREMQKNVECSVDIFDERSVGDAVIGIESVTGVSISSFVEKKILRINESNKGGVIECQVGDVVSKGSVSQKDYSSNVLSTVPTASETVKGGVRVGENLKVNDDVMSVEIMSSADIAAL